MSYPAEGLVNIYKWKCNILTSDPVELSNKKCTCVNNRCTRSKISGDNPWLWTGWIECRCDAHWSRWMSNNYITRCYRKFELFGDQSLEWVVAVRSSENQTQKRAGPSGPLFEQPCRMRKKFCYSQKIWGSICCSFGQSTTHLSHNNPFVTLSYHFE